MFPLPPSYKAIIVFTPGGDLVYSIDPDKRRHWHLDLCMAIQEVWGLREPPHFLIPIYTATLDCYRDPKTQTLRIYAEAYPLTYRYRYFLNALFQVETQGVAMDWRCLPNPEGQGEGAILAQYQQQFPQLWQCQDWVLNLQQLPQARWSFYPQSFENLAPEVADRELDPGDLTAPEGGYVLRLFVSGHGAGTVEILKRLYQLLETYVSAPYTLKVIDINKYPEQTEANQIKAIPTLVRVWPKPIYRVVGYFDRWEQLCQIFRD
jgi:circadian clock protein KaiB